MKLVSITEIFFKLTSSYPFREEPNESYIVEWVRSAFRMIDAYDQWEKKTIVVTIKDHKTFLPLDFQSLDYKASNSKCRLQGNEMYFSSKQGTSTLKYLAIPLDEDNRPLIPDVESVKDAFMYFCAAKFYGNETLIETQKKNEESEHEKWLQKKFESRAEINGMRIGELIQGVSDDYRTFNRFRTQPTWNNR